MLAALRQILLESLRLGGERLATDAHAGPFDGGKHRNEWALEIAIHAVESISDEQGPEPVGKLPRQIGPLTRVLENRRRGNIGQADGLRALSTEVFLGAGFVTQVFERRPLEPMAGA